MDTMLNSAEMKYFDARWAAKNIHKNFEKAEHDAVILNAASRQLTENVLILKDALPVNGYEIGIGMLLEKLDKVSSAVASINQRMNLGEDNIKDGRWKKENIESSSVERKVDRDTIAKSEHSLESSVAQRNTENEAILAACDNLKNFIRESNDDLCQRREESPISKWCLDICELLDIRKRDLGDNKLAFEFSNPSNATEHPPCLVLTVTYANVTRPIKYFKMIEAEINVCSLLVDDVIELAVRRNDCRYLLHQLTRRWHKHFPLFNEVAAIRQRKYPIDWMIKEKKICILLGARSTIKCMLSISSEYPSSGTIDIEDLSGAPQHMDLNHLKPPGEENPSLLMWIEYLADTFSKL